MAQAGAAAGVAVLDFELKDVTPAPNTPAEIARTASIKPLLEEQLQRAGHRIVTIDKAAAEKAAAGPGYLYDHPDLAAELGRSAHADYIVVGRLHKPSYLFVYLMAHLVDVRTGKPAGNFIAEIKGGEKKLTRKGVENLAVQMGGRLSR